MSTPTKPSIVFCHGIWADGSCFNKLIAPLQAEGYEVVSAQYGLNSNVEDVAGVSAQWVISNSGGHAGVVVFTDASIPFAKNKSDLIRKELATCEGVKLLSYVNIPISDASSRGAKPNDRIVVRFELLHRGLLAPAATLSKPTRPRAVE